MLNPIFLSDDAPFDRMKPITHTKVKQLSHDSITSKALVARSLASLSLPTPLKMSYDEVSDEQLAAALQQYHVRLQSPDLLVDCAFLWQQSLAWCLFVTVIFFP